MKALNVFTKRRIKGLAKLLQHFPSGTEKEELHKIRLEIKKIKAVLRLIHYNHNKFQDHKHYIPFRTIFRETGKIREKGIRNELLEKYTQLHTSFYRSPDKAIQRFIENIPDHIRIIRKQKKIILRETDKITSPVYNKYLRKKEKELDQFLTEKFSQRDLHLLRKLIKEIIYLTQVKIKKKKLDTFLIQSDTLIGNWHDKVILIPWIRSHAPKEKSTLRLLQRESKNDLVQLRQLIAQH